MRPMSEPMKIRVAVNGYGVIGKRVAAAVALQEDMSLAGVSDVVTDWRARTALHASSLYAKMRRIFSEYGESS